MQKPQKHSKNVQISQETFIKLCRYFFLDEPTDALERAIKSDLEAKLDALAKHELYSTYKNGTTEAERETARQAYLDKIGVPADFRW